jgi:putative ABC transport system ATP-binding protein
MIRITNLRFQYTDGDFSLNVPELAIARGEKTAIIGPSGSGKTTLLHVISGIRLPGSGRVVTRGEEVTNLDDAARRAFRIRYIGLVFQEFELLEYLTVLDNILLPYRIHPSLDLDRGVRERAVELARQVDIEDKLDRPANLLSHGEKQRVAVCRALLVDPELILADEPTGNLDPANKGRVMEILLDYATNKGTTLVTVTHDHNLLDRFDRVIDFQTFHGVAPSRDTVPETAS